MVAMNYFRTFYFSRPASRPFGSTFWHFLYNISKPKPAEMCTLQPIKSAEFLYTKVQRHTVYIGNASPDHVSEYKANFQWPPLSAYPTLKSVEKPPTATDVPTTDDTATTVESLKSADTETSECSHREPKRKRKCSKCGSASKKDLAHDATRWKRLLIVTDKILGTGYNMFTVAKAKTSIQKQKLDKSVLLVNRFLLVEATSADANTRFNGRSKYPHGVLALYREFNAIVASLVCMSNVSSHTGL